MELSKATSQEISLRIKYESFAKLTAEVSSAQTIQELSDILRAHLKYLFNFSFFRILVQYKNQHMRFHISRTVAASYTNIDAIYPVEQEAIDRNIPIVYTQEDLIQNPDRYHPLATELELTQFCLFPIKSDNDQVMLICACNKEHLIPNESDYRFLRLLGQFLLTKVSQLILTHQLGNIITERTAQLQQVNNELSILFYKSSHELTSPFTTLKGLNQLIDLHGNGNNELTELVTLSNKVIENAMGMLQRLKAISEIDTLINYQDSLDLPILIEKIVKNKKAAADAKSITVSIQYKGLENVQLNRELLSILLNACIDNAIDYHVASENPFVKIIVRSNADNLHLEISDNGQGMNEHTANSAFNLYYRGHQDSKGSGLGLYVVKKIVEKIGGTAKVSSTVDVGTTFTIVLPQKDHNFRLLI